MRTIATFKGRTIALLALGLSMLAGPALAQTSSAELSGVLRDESGAAVPEAKLTARNVDTGFALTATTGATGRYRIPNLPPGRYEVRAEAGGFSPLVRTGIELTIGQRAALDLVLKLSGLAEVVTVSGEGPIVEITRTEASQIIEGRRIAELPINGRQFTEFALLTPSVAVGKAITGGGLGPLQENVTKVAFAGLSEQHSNFFSVDGADHNISLSGFQHLTPSQEAVQEFRIVTNSYSAEYGRALGGIVNILTRSGANDFRGSAYYFGRNDALDSKSVLTAPGLDVLRQHQFGASLGGPLVKDRTFYFLNYEGQRREQSPTYSAFVLTSLPAINAIKAYYHLPPERLDVLRFEDNDQLLARLDHHMGRSHLTARYNVIDQRNDNLAGAPGNSGTPSTFRKSPIRDQSGILKLLSVFSEDLTNEALVQVSYRDFRYENKSGEPHLSIPNLLDVGRVIGPADAYKETRYQIRDTVSLQAGSHRLKIGADFSHIRNSITWPLAPNGFFIFSPDSFFGASPFGGLPTPLLFLFTIPRELAGQPIPPRSTDWPNVLYPSPGYEELAQIQYDHDTFDVFVQDDWRPTSRLTLNYGVRYFVETRGDFDANEDLDNVQPRFGFAYSLSSRSVVRGGFGIFHGPLSWANSLAGDRSGIGGGFSSLSRLLGPEKAQEFGQQDPRGVTLSPVPLPQFNGPAAFFFITQGLYPSRIPLIQHVFNHASNDLPNPYSLQWSAQAEHELARDLAVTLSYLGVSTRDLITTIQSNHQVVGRAPNGKTLFAPLSPEFGLYHLQFPDNRSIYHGGTLAIAKRFRHGFGVNANYTFSKAIDRVNSGSSQSFKDVAEDPTNLDLNRGLSNQHVGHRFVLSLVAEGSPGSFLRNFRLGSVVTLESPRFYTIFTGFDANGDLEPGSDRVGTIGRNTYRGDSFRTVDLRVSRVFGLGGGVRAELTVDVFNVFNRTNVTDINTVYGSPLFVGPPPLEFGDGAIAPVPSFGTPAQVGNPREVQLGLKLTF